MLFAVNIRRRRQWFLNWRLIEIFDDDVSKEEAVI